VGRREIRVWTWWHLVRDTGLRSTASPLLETLAPVIGPVTPELNLKIDL
jgi:hypothetical protein